MRHNKLASRIAKRTNEPTTKILSRLLVCGRLNIALVKANLKSLAYEAWPHSTCTLRVYNSELLYFNITITYVTAVSHTPMFVAITQGLVADQI